MQPTFSSSRPTCQICGKLSHSALDCFHRMDHSYQGRHPLAQLAAMIAQTPLTKMTLGLPIVELIIT
jgi:hypothetical protein